MDYSGFTKRGLQNAEFFLEKIVEGKRGETIVFIANEFTYPETTLMSLCAKQLGMKPFIVDLSIYGINWFMPEDFEFIPALKSAIEAADICVTTCMTYAKLLGSSKNMDAILTGEKRCYAYWSHFMQEWEFDQNEVLMGRKRCVPLRDLLKKSKILHLTTPKGTDLTCEVGIENMNAIYEVLAIAPFFAEVAIIPKYGTVNGIAVIDGASSKGLINNEFGKRELNLEPIRMTIKDSVVTDMTGNPLHMERINKYIHDFDPIADHIDEVGIVTCTATINDDYQWRIWNDGSHHSNSFHIALGNNVSERSDVVHAKAHCDFDMWNPVMELDGHIIYKDGKFDDDYIFKASGYSL